MVLLNKTKCLCGKELSHEQFQKIKPNYDRNFYGGCVYLIGEHICSCGRELRGFYGRRDGKYVLIDLEVIKDITQLEKIENTPISNVIIEDEEEYSDLSYNELKKMAKEKGINYPNNITKTELLNLLAH